MPRVIIGSTPIDFPNTGTDAVWSEAVDEFVVAVEEQLNGIVSIYDITPRVQDLNIGAAVDETANVSACIFNPTFVRGFVFSYALYRTNGTLALAENGTVSGAYNTSTSLWELEHQFSGVRDVNGNFYHKFDMSGNQLTIKATAITGTVSGSKISYSAKTFKRD